jgi:hypothetical protein
MFRLMPVLSLKLILLELEYDIDVNKAASRTESSLDANAGQ